MLPARRLPPTTSPTPNLAVAAASRHSTSVHLGLAADSVAQADYDMATTVASEEPSGQVADILRLCLLGGYHFDSNRQRLRPLRRLPVLPAALDELRRLEAYILRHRHRLDGERVHPHPGDLGLLRLSAEPVKSELWLPSQTEF